MTEKILERLDILIKLNVANLIKDDKTQTESILKLSRSGIGSKKIAEILGTTENCVTTAIARGKKKNGKTKK